MQGDPITISADATDADGSVSTVNFYANGLWIGQDTTSPYSITWTRAVPGAHNLTAIATDNLGSTGRSAITPVTVEGVDSEGEGESEREVVGQELIIGGDFPVGLGAWSSWFKQPGAGGTVSVVGGELAITMTGAGAATSDVQVWHPNLAIHKGSTYEVSFDARCASGARTIESLVQKHGAPFTSYNTEQSTLTTTMQRLTYSFTAAETDVIARFVFYAGGQGLNGVFIDNVSISVTEVGDSEEEGNGVGDRKAPSITKGEE
jgi:chitinase